MKTFPATLITLLYFLQTNNASFLEEGHDYGVSKVPRHAPVFPDEGDEVLNSNQVAGLVTV